MMDLKQKPFFYVKSEAFSFPSSPIYRPRRRLNILRYFFIPSSRYIHECCSAVLTHKKKY